MAKILHFIGSLEMGGTEKMLLAYLMNTANKELEHGVCTLYDHGTLKDEFKKAKIPVRSLKIKGKLGLFGAIGQFIEVLEKEKPDIVHSYLLQENLVAREAVGKFNRKHPGGKIILINGKRDTDRGKSFWKVWLDRQGLNKADLHVSNSKAGVEELVSYGLPKEKIAYIPNGKNLSKNEKVTKQNAKEKLSIKPDTFVITCVARLYQFKGHRYLLEAMENAQEHLKGLEWKLLLVGEGQMRKNLEQYVSSQQLARHIIFMGERNDVPLILNASDLFVLPSLREGMPGALMEAMAAGLPCIATEIDGCKELIENGKNGLLVPQKDSQALSMAILSLILDPILSARLGKEAQKTIEEEFSLKKMVERIDRLYITITK